MAATVRLGGPAADIFNVESCHRFIRSSACTSFPGFHGFVDGFSFFFQNMLFWMFEKDATSLWQVQRC